MSDADTYEVTIERRAAKALAKLQRKDAERVRAVIDGLRSNPRPRGTFALTGPLSGTYRVKVGDHLRVLWTVDDEERRVTVVNLGQREGIY